MHSGHRLRLSRHENSSWFVALDAPSSMRMHYADVEFVTTWHVSQARDSKCTSIRSDSLDEGDLFQIRRILNTEQPKRSVLVVRTAGK